MQIKTRKLSLSDWNPIMFHSAHLLFSPTGIFMLSLVLIFGGGTLWFLMGRVSPQGLGYVLIQPVAFTIYLLCLMARFRSGNSRISIKHEIRNVFVCVALGFMATIIILSVLFLFRLYSVDAHAAEIAPVISSGSSDVARVPFNAVPFNSASASFLHQFPTMFTTFSVAAFTVLIIMPGIVVLIGALVNCDAPLHRNLWMMICGIMKNIKLLVVMSFFSSCIMFLWSYLTVINQYFTFTSILPITFIVLMNYVIAEQIYLPQKALRKTTGMISPYNIGED